MLFFARVQSEQKRKDPISAYVPQFKSCISSDSSIEKCWLKQSLHNVQAAKVTVDEIEAQAEADAMCLGWVPAWRLTSIAAAYQTCSWHVINVWSYIRYSLIPNWGKLKQTRPRRQKRLPMRQLQAFSEKFIEVSAWSMKRRSEMHQKLAHTLLLDFKP